MNTYPDTVQEFMDESVKDLHYFFEDEKFFVTPEEGINAYHKVMGPVALKSWMETGEVYFEDDKIAEVLVKTITSCALDSMKSIGLIDSMPDENGDEVMWLTEKGKELGNLITEDFDPNEMNQRLNNELK
jgi:hypothetical protein